MACPRFHASEQTRANLRRQAGRPRKIASAGKPGQSGDAGRFAYAAVSLPNFKLRLRANAS